MAGTREAKLMKPIRRKGPREPALPGDLDQFLRCPACRSPLAGEGGGYACRGCGACFPRVEGVPILLEGSTLAWYDRIRGGQSNESGRLVRLIDRLTPKPTRNVKSARNLALLGELLSRRAAVERPRVLVIGGSVLGGGMEGLLSCDLDVVETDIALGPRTSIVCEVQALPFAEESFDAVVVQAVLAQVPDPERAVDEIAQVLKSDGLVYAEDGFMVQVWGGRYDFTRWTQVGYRRLFRRFEEIASGPVCGPGTALVWAWQYFLLSFSCSTRIRRVLRAFARLTGFWLKYFDDMLIDRAGAIDAAASLFFLGRKTGRSRSDREIVEAYRGAIGT